MGVSEVVSDPRGYLWTRGQMYRALLFSPGRFYDEYVGERGLKSEALLVTFVGVIGTIGTFFAVTTIRSQFDTGPVQGGLPRGISMQLWAEAIGPMVGAFLLWFGLAIVLYLVSWAYSTLGGAYQALKNSAWALFPLAFANLVSTIAYVVTTLAADINTDFYSAGGTTDLRVQFLWSQIGHEPMVLGARAVGLLFVLWVGYIAAHAIADVRDIPARQGYVVAAVPVLLYVVWEGLDLVAAY